MQVSVRLQLEGGEFRAAYAGRLARGDLYLTYRTSENRRVPVLQLLGVDRAFRACTTRGWWSCQAPPCALSATSVRPARG
jgi:hypothetical protein